MAKYLPSLEKVTLNCSPGGQEKRVVARPPEAHRPMNPNRAFDLFHRARELADPAERLALVLMDYRNIAKVFDAGAIETGPPYSVIEYAKGIPITECCDK